MPKTKTIKRRPTTVWRVKGPGGTWSIWDFGDELTVHDGPGLLDNVVVSVRPEIASRLDAGSRKAHMEDAAGAIHVALLLQNPHPNFHLLWRS